MCIRKMAHKHERRKAVVSHLKYIMINARTNECCSGDDECVRFVVTEINLPNYGI